MKKTRLKVLMIMLLLSMSLLSQSTVYSAEVVDAGKVTVVEENSTTKCNVCGKERSSCTCVTRDVNIECGTSTHTLELCTSGTESSTPEKTVLVLYGLNNDIRNLKTVELEFSIYNSIEIAGKRLNTKESRFSQPTYVKVIPSVIEEAGTKKIVITLSKITACSWFEKIFGVNPKKSNLSKIRFNLNLSNVIKTPSNNKFVVYSKDKNKPFNEAVVIKQKLESIGKTSLLPEIKTNFIYSDINGKNIDANLMYISSHGCYDTGRFTDSEVPKSPPAAIGSKQKQIPFSNNVINKSKVNWLIVSACRIFHPMAESHLIGYFAKSKNLKGLFGYGGAIYPSDLLSEKIASRYNESMLNAWFKSNAEIWYSKFKNGVKASDNKYNSASAIFSVNSLDDPMYGDISQRCQQFATVKFKRSGDQIVHTLKGDGTLRSITLVITIGSSVYDREVLF